MQSERSSGNATSSHPCADHQCDGCFCCRVLQVCCASVSPQERAQLEAEYHSDSSPNLAALVVAEADTFLSSSLNALIRQAAVESSVTGTALPLLPLTPPASLSTPIRKEPHVIASHPQH